MKNRRVEAWLTSMFPTMTLGDRLVGCGYRVYMEDGHDDEPHCYYVKTRDGARLIGKFFFSDGERAVRIEMYENDDLFEGVAAQFGVVVKTDSPTREVPVGAARLTRFERAALLVLLLFALAMMVVLLALGLRDPRGFWEWFRSLDTV